MSSSSTSTSRLMMGGHGHNQSQNQNQNQNQNGNQKGMVPPPPHLDGESTKMLNLTVLQRMDELVEEILITAAHVTLYQFNIDLNQWSRKDVEGSLFLVKRNTQPRFQFIVMNRRNTDNLVEDLLGDFEYEVQVPYLLYRNAAQEVNGIWFYNSHECEAVANLFNRILSAFSKLPPKTKLSSAKSEFEELEAVPSMSVLEGPLEPQPSAVSTPPDVADDSFINFFSTALSTGNASNPANIVGRQHSLTAPGPAHSHVQTAVSMVPPVLQASVPLPISTTPHIPSLHTPDPISNVTTNQSSSLLKPSFFTPPSTAATLMMPPLVSSSVPTAPPLQPAVTLQRPYGTPLLQPFPPPTPPPSLTPAQSNSPVITREKVQEALIRLAQNNKFIDMVYQEILNAHHS